MIQPEQLKQLGFKPIKKAKKDWFVIYVLTLDDVRLEVTIDLEIGTQTFEINIGNVYKTIHKPITNELLTSVIEIFTPCTTN